MTRERRDDGEEGESGRVKGSDDDREGDSGCEDTDKSEEGDLGGMKMGARRRKRTTMKMMVRVVGGHQPRCVLGSTLGCVLQSVDVTCRHGACRTVSFHAQVCMNTSRCRQRSQS